MDRKILRKNDVHYVAQNSIVLGKWVIGCLANRLQYTLFSVKSSPKIQRQSI